MRRLGRRGREYIEWRDSVAIPYLDKKFGHVCSVEDCYSSVVDVAHIKGRGAHPKLKMELTNVRYLCRPHHQKEPHA